MGFFKRFLSLSSSKHRKSKKKQNAANANTRVDAEGRIVAERGTQDPDTSANRLLRSSSTKFSVMAEIDYTALPPLPHSVQDLLNTGTPNLSPSPSLVTVATTPGLQRSGTYVVKVHGRTTHSRTEFPLANPPISPTKPSSKQPQHSEEPKPDELECFDNVDVDEHEQQPRLKEVNFTPKDTSRLYKLRRDPSVASLLNLYDDKGCLDSAIFENSPRSPAPISAPPEGPEPVKRSGSTLRHLLGGPGPAFLNNTTEGDISWAERFLDEQLGDDSPLSSPSSLDLETPKDALFSDSLSAPRVAVDTTFSSLDPDSSINYPAISSMEVEVSGSEEDVPIVEVAPVPKVLLPDPKTPQRASEVFGFLSRRNTLTVKERDLPPIPLTLSPETTGDTQHLQTDLYANDNSLGEHLDATPSANTSHSTQLTSSDTNSHASHAQIQTATMTKLASAFAASTTSLNLLVSQDRTEENDDLITASTSKGVAVNNTCTTSSSSAHAASHHTGSSLSSSNSMKVPPTKIPRGPRPRPLSICRRDANDSPDAPEDTMHQLDAAITIHQRRGSDENARSSKREAFTHIPQRQHKRIASRSSAHSADGVPSELPELLAKPSAHQRKHSTKPEQFALGKENTPSPPPAASRRVEPRVVESSIPMLGFATPERHRVLVDPPSRASSSELSPVAREMMSDLRQQRMRARQVERRRGFWGRE